MAVWIVRLVGPMPAARCKTKRDLQRKAKRSWTVRRTIRQGGEDDSSQPQHTSAQQQALHSSIAPGQCCATFLLGQVGGRGKGGIFGNRQFWARAFGRAVSFFFRDAPKKPPALELSSCARDVTPGSSLRSAYEVAGGSRTASSPRLAFDLCPEKLDSRFGVSLCPFRLDRCQMSNPAQPACVARARGLAKSHTAAENQLDSFVQWRDLTSLPAPTSSQARGMTGNTTSTRQRWSECIGDLGVVRARARVAS